jgi:hypothetical protein
LVEEVGGGGGGEPDDLRGALGEAAEAGEEGEAEAVAEGGLGAVVGAGRGVAGFTVEVAGRAARSIPRHLPSGVGGEPSGVGLAGGEGGFLEEIAGEQQEVDGAVEAMLDESRPGEEGGVAKRRGGGGQVEGEWCDHTIPAGM